MNKKKIIILGAGIAGIKIYQELHKKLCHRHTCDVRIMLVNRTNYFTFVPLLHEASTGGVEDSHVITPLREFVPCNNHDVYTREVTGVDVAKQVVKTDQGDMHYDYLVVAMGSSANYFGIPGAQEHSFSIKTYIDAQRLRNHLNSLFEEASEAQQKDQRVLMHIAIIGGGAVGVELAGQLGVLLKDVCKLYPRIKRDVFRVSLVHTGDRLLPQLEPKMSRWATRELERLGITLILNHRVVEVKKDAVMLDDGSVLKTRSNIWTAGAKPNTQGIIPKELLDEKGFIVVDPTLSVVGHRAIFAAGDVARIYSMGAPSDAPMIGEFAHNSAKVVAENIARLVRGSPDLKIFHFHSKGMLIPIGDWFALAKIFGFQFKGRLAWWLRRTVYLMYIYNWRDRFRVVIDWTLDIFGTRDTTRY
ncbi:MAG TPA: hypothetical protein DDW36_02115 [Candidatus Magasanikbacteria bacterium]|nr:hypothetical protein [Candidatus Magasanikbacteria bacterium]